MYGSNLMDAVENNHAVHDSVSSEQTLDIDTSLNMTDHKDRNDGCDEHPKKLNEQMDFAGLKTEHKISCLNTTSQEAISPAWVFGFNHSVPLINLSDDQSSVVFYVSAHLLILFDIKNNRQKILRGHCNEVMSITCSGNKRWLASGDRGIDNTVIVWDVKTGEAVRTIRKPHEHGVLSIALTKDARYLATLSADPFDQSFAIWNWTTGSNSPHCHAKISGEMSFQTKITFNSDNYFHLSTTGDHQVIFYSWNNEEKNMVAYAPSLKDEDFKQKIGQFSCTLYIPNKYIAITGTSTGLLVIWESDKQPSKGENSETPYKRASKLIPLHEKGITFVTITDCHPCGKCIVTGDSGGRVKFLDDNFMLLFWYDDLKCGPVNCVSFATTSLFTEKNQPSFIESVKGKDYPTCATITAEPFIVEDFIVSTSNAAMISVKVEGGFQKIILRDHDSDVNGLTTHPVMNHVAACSHSGLLKVYDYESKLVIAMKSFGVNNPIQSCVYDKTGQFIGQLFVYKLP
ncbi:unnamed protein product [Schistosoma turkestanicum]|nr:unnamed protein product [Schistosoma turkestanicum]